MRVFISGTISKGGTLSAPEIRNNIEKFGQAEVALRKLGYEPVNPLPLHVSNELPSETYELWVIYLRQDIKVLVGCDAIYQIEGWEDSRGARLEAHIASELGLTFIQVALN